MDYKLNDLNIIGIIPARYASSRFPGKPLADINGKSMIERVYENSAKVLENITVATDSKLIFDEVNRFGGKAVMTSENHKSGTDRCAEALEITENERNLKFDIVINIQGDEPFLHEEHLIKLITCFNDKESDIATLAKKITDNEDIFNPNKPKVIFNKHKQALYFSRSPIPYLRNYEKKYWHLKHSFYKHIGIYAYRSDILREITKLPASELELAESLEQNRWLENGFKIKTDLTEKESFSVDTPEDLRNLIKKFQ
ncbi:MAG: 3-deoxy-manno-octulosonate cytidylyltransferase [Chlorobi bacterium]|nr:3-deoxy-manno-octulosonate cytidylyltransferase [Chlorobiota bacterium]